MNISIYQTDDNVHFLNISDVILTITDLYKEKEWYVDSSAMQIFNHY
jgi:hypothetical protein